MSERAWKIWERFCLFLILCWMIQYSYFSSRDRTRNDNIRAENSIKQDKEALDRRIKDYMACKGPACDRLYPDAALAVKKAEAEVKAEQTVK